MKEDKEYYYLVDGDEIKEGDEFKHIEEGWTTTVSVGRRFRQCGFTKMRRLITKPKEAVNSPNHYNRYSVEAIEMAVRIFGKEKVAIACEIDAFYYRMRLGLKDDFKQDLAKEKWNLDKAKELRGQ